MNAQGGLFIVKQASKLLDEKLSNSVMFQLRALTSASTKIEPRNIYSIKYFKTVTGTEYTVY